MSKLRICLCISGQMRRFEENFGWLDAARETYDIAVVVATFAQRGGKILGDLSAPRIRSLFPSNVSDALPPTWIGGSLFEHLPGLRERAMSKAFQDRVTASMITEVLPGAHVHIDEQFSFRWFEKAQYDGRAIARDPFSMQMLFKIWQADLLRQNIEVETGRLFDVVVRMRPDRPLSGLDMCAQGISTSRPCASMIGSWATSLLWRTAGR